MFLLVIVLIPGIGTEAFGSRRWIVSRGSADSSRPSSPSWRSASISPIGSTGAGRARGALEWPRAVHDPGCPRLPADRIRARPGDGRGLRRGLPGHLLHGRREPPLPRRDGCGGPRRSVPDGHDHGLPAAADQRLPRPVPRPAAHRLQRGAVADGAGPRRHRRPASAPAARSTSTSRPPRPTSSLPSLARSGA